MGLKIHSQISASHRKGSSVSFVEIQCTACRRSAMFTRIQPSAAVPFVIQKTIGKGRIAPLQHCNFELRLGKQVACH
jgi:hypothetical protein